MLKNVSCKNYFPQVIVIAMFIIMLTVTGNINVSAVSTPITGVSINSFTRYESCADTWLNTWADNDQVYSGCCDCTGFAPSSSSNWSNFMLTGVNGTSGNLSGTNINTMRDSSTQNDYGFAGKGDAPSYDPNRVLDNCAWKQNGLTCVDGVLYFSVSRDKYGNYASGYRQSAQNSSVIKSTDHGATWSRSENTNYHSPMFPGQRFGSFSFVQYGKDYKVPDGSGGWTPPANGGYVYAVSNNGYWNNGDNIIIGRVPRGSIGNLNASDWQFYKGGDGWSSANWSSNSNDAALIINDPGKCGQATVQYIWQLDRYILLTWYYTNMMSYPDTPDGENQRYRQCKLVFYESPTPWGSWTKVGERYYDIDGWYNPDICPKFISSDGLSMSAFVSGDFKTLSKYALHEMRLTLMTGSTPATTVDDYTTGTGTNQFEYAGAWYGDSSRSSAYSSTEHYSQTNNDYLQVRFNGTQIKYYSSKANDMGKAAISIDGGTETTVDFYNSSKQWQQLIYDSGTLSSGSHTLKLRLNGQKNGSSSGYWICADKVEISNGTAPTSTPTPTPTPGGSSNIAINGTDTSSYKWNGSGWTSIGGANNSKIAVDSFGNVWVVNTSNQTWKYTTSWTQITGSASDIAAGGNGTVAINGTDGASYKWNGSGWTSIGGANNRNIAVDSFGNVWVVNTSNQIWKYTTSWTQITGSASDIGAGGNGTVAINGTDGASYKWNGSGWTSIGGANNRNIAVDSGGNVWVVNTSNQIWKYTTSWTQITGSALDIGGY